MNQLRLLASLAVLAALAISASPAQADHQTGEVTLNVEKSIGNATVSGPGINCGEDCTQTYTLGENCTFVGEGGNHNDGRVQCDTVYPTPTLTTSSTSGIPFTGWAGGGCSGTGTCRPTFVNNPTTVRAVYADTAQPTVAITGPASGHYSGDLNYTATASDNDVVDRVEFYVGTNATPFAVDHHDSAPGASSTYSSGNVRLADGRSITVHAVAIDKADNYAPRSSRTYTLDNGWPQAQITAPAERDVLTGQTTITANATDTYGVGSVAFEVGGDAPVIDDEAPYAAPLDLTSRPDGPLTIRATVRDLATPANTSGAEVRVTVDNTAPQLAITAGPAEGSTISDRNPLIQFSASDATGLTFDCRLDGGISNACPARETSDEGGSVRVQDLADGTHTVTIQGTDQAGHTTRLTRTFVVDGPDDGPPPEDDPPDDGPPDDGPPDDGPPETDRTAPDTSIAKGPKRRTTKRTAKFAFATTEAGARFECQLEKKKWKPCSARHKIKVKPGKHTLSVRSIDAAGNTDSTPAVRRWRVSR